VAEKSIYKDLYQKVKTVFGESVRPGSQERNTILNMVGSLADQIGPENVTELNLVGIREILDGEHDPIIHVSSL